MLLGVDPSGDPSLKIRKKEKSASQSYVHLNRIKVGTNSAVRPPGGGGAMLSTLYPLSTGESKKRSVSMGWADTMKYCFPSVPDAESYGVATVMPYSVFSSPGRYASHSQTRSVPFNGAWRV